MAIAPPTFLDKLSLAFVPGQLEAFGDLAAQRVDRVDAILTPNLTQIFPGSELTNNNGNLELHLGVIPNFEVMAQAAGFIMQRMLWTQIMDDATFITRMRDVFYGGITITGWLRNSCPTFALITGTTTALLGVSIYQMSANSAEERHARETFLHTHLPPNIAQPFFAP